jgi:hypothetical protein
MICGYRLYSSTTVCQCAVTDENQTLVTDLGYCLGYLFVIASGLFLNPGSNSTCTILPRNISVGFPRPVQHHGLPRARMSCACRHIWMHGVFPYFFLSYSNASHDFIRGNVDHLGAVTGWLQADRGG